MCISDRDSGIHEECGVFGAYDFDGNDIASTLYYGLFALQHRGQESCGIAVSDTDVYKRQVLMHMDYASVKIKRSWHKVYIGVGSNLGEREEYMKLAKERVSGLPKDVYKRQLFYSSC